MTEKIILGIDEVGRGPWAGPLVVGAVILGPTFSMLPEYEQLTDSKKLTAKKRQALNEIVLKHAAATGLGWVAASEIDRYGLGPALKLASRRAVKQILTQISQNHAAIESTISPAAPPDNLTITPEAAIPDQETTAPLLKFDEIIIDGTINLLSNTPLADKVTLLPKADFLIKEVSAASIIAKVARDSYMTDLSKKYPGYGFEKHVGYGTAAHKSALLELGPCPEHRCSFRPVADLLASMPAIPSSSSPVPLDSSKPSSPSSPRQTPGAPTTPDTTTVRGQKAEQIVAKYLETEHNHTIIARNFKTKSYEIDLISTNLDPQSPPTSQTPIIYFTEVKYRKTSTHGTPLAAITPKKHQQIRFAAETFLVQHPEYQHFQPTLAVASVSGSDFHLDDWFTLSE